ncbi:MAG: tRNA guanosine(15) transglycosylase TgtA [Thermoplasmataceae archaeon]
MEIIRRDGLARIGRFTTLHGKVETPTILPVVNPNLLVITPKEMKKLGAQAIITNSYIIRRNATLRENALKNGIHSLMDFDGPIMTDSGTFQSYVYGDVEYTNQEIVEFQRSIGSDITTILDIFSKPDDTYDQAKNAVMETYRRIEEIPELSGPMLAGPIQGSIYPDLRKESAELMGRSKADYLPIGGVVPLLENYNYDTLVDIIVNSRINTNLGKPVHLFGGGHPMFLAMAVYLGVDLFDSASYVKYARDGRLLYPEGSRDITKIRDFPYWSPLFGKYSPMEVNKLEKQERTELLARHNLAALFMELDEIKERIHEETLFNYIQEKSRAHPYLYRAFRRILDHRDNIAYFQDISKKSPFFYYDSMSLLDPVLSRLRAFSMRYVERNRRETVIVPADSWRPGVPLKKEILALYESNPLNVMLEWCDLLVPVELEETYPVEQYLSSWHSDQKTFIENYNSVAFLVKPYEVRYLKDVLINPDEEIMRNFDLEKIRTVADFQFGTGSGLVLFPDGCVITKSRSTGRIRNILSDGKITGTMRTMDGFFTLTTEGGEKLRLATPYPLGRVVVNSDSAEYNRRGFNVFFKFIVEADENIVAGNDVLVVDENDRLLAVGKSTVSGKELSFYDEGVAVKVHHSINSHQETD